MLLVDCDKIWHEVPLVIELKHREKKNELPWFWMAKNRWLYTAVMNLDFFLKNHARDEQKSTYFFQKNWLPSDFRFHGHTTRILVVQIDQFDEMVFAIFVPIDLIMQIGTMRGHEKRGNLGRFLMPLLTSMTI